MALEDSITIMGVSLKEVFRQYDGAIERLRRSIPRGGVEVPLITMLRQASARQPPYEEEVPWYIRKAAINELFRNGEIASHRPYFVSPMQYVSSPK